MSLQETPSQELSPKESGGEFSVVGKVVVVTGAASGIGRSTAKVFTDRGARICLLDVNLEQAKAVGRELPGSLVWQLDVRDPDAIEAVVTAIVKEAGVIDILVNCAGIGPIDWAESFPRKDWDNTLAINLSGAFFMSQSVGRTMITAKRGGKIINLASQAALVAIDKHVAYSASKAAILAVTRSMAFEWGKYHINVNAISPTATLTPMIEGYWDQSEVQREALANTPVGRYCRPEEIALAALYLASPAADMVTGANLVIDGGFTIH